MCWREENNSASCSNGGRSCGQSRVSGKSPKCQYDPGRRDRFWLSASGDTERVVNLFLAISLVFEGYEKAEPYLAHSLNAREQDISRKFNYSQAFSRNWPPDRRHKNSNDDPTIVIFRSEADLLADPFL